MHLDLGYDMCQAEHSMTAPVRRTFHALLPPFLFASYPVLSLYAYNHDIVPIADLLWPLIIVLALAFLLVLGLRHKFTDRIKSGIMASILMISFGSFGHFVNLVTGFASFLPFHKGIAEGGLDLTKDSYAIASFIASYVALTAALLISIARSKKDLAKISGALNLAGVALVLPLLAYVSFSSLGKSAGSPPRYRPGALSLTDAPRETPDIYYIILDGYGREDILKNHFNFDNSPFINRLKSLGFHVATRSRANYNWTFLSLASSLNYSYVNSLADSEGRDARDRARAFRMIKDNGVARFLKARGYRYIHFDSSWGATQSNPYADIEIDFSSGLLKKEFARMWLSTSVLRVFERAQETHLAARHLYNYSQLKAVHKLPGPKFVFFHSLPPHHPYLFDRSGNVQRKATLNTQFEFEKRLWKEKEKYLEQLQFVNDRILAAVNTILAKTTPPPLIILQSDHGPTLADVGHETYLQARMAIFSATYVPHGNRLIGDASTPVNTFRLLFNRYFSAGLDILEDKSYFSEYRRPYDFQGIPDEALR